MTKNSIIRELAAELAKKCVAVRIAETHEVYAHNKRRELELELASVNRALDATKSRLAGAESELANPKREKEYLSSELNQRDEEIEQMRRNVMAIARQHFGPVLQGELAVALGLPR